MIATFFNYLDPFSILFLEESGIINRSSLSGLSAASFTESLAKNLQINPDGEVALKQTVVTFIKEKEINFIDSDFYHMKNQKFLSKNKENRLIDDLPFNQEFYLTSFFMGSIDSNKFLQISLSNSVYSRIKLIIDFTIKNSKIDINSTVNHLYSLSDMQKNLEKLLQRRLILIHSEYRKTLIILIIQSCILGLLIGLDPFFSVIRSLSLIYNPSEFYTAINSLNSFQTIFFVSILCFTYFGVQIFTIKAIYKYSNKINLITYLIIISICFIFGYNFVRAIITPSFI